MSVRRDRAFQSQRIRETTAAAPRWQFVAGLITAALAWLAQA